MANALGLGSGRPNIPTALGDFSIGGVSTRVLPAGTSPTDADWPDTPPNGTVCFEGDSIRWTRLGGSWVEELIGG